VPITPIAAIAIVSFVVAIDQASKAAIRLALGDGTLSLGALGGVRVVESRIWLLRRRTAARSRLWTTLAAGTVGAVLASMAVPAVGPWFALALGGACSNALETTVRGSVSDYLCPRFWPAFNLADVAIGTGAMGILLQLIREIF
jgi:lipoprotein signal peptidase